MLIPLRSHNLRFLNVVQENAHKIFFLKVQQTVKLHDFFSVQIFMSKSDSFVHSPNIFSSKDLRRQGA